MGVEKIYLTWDDVDTLLDRIYQQSKDYKNKILSETEFVVSIEASETHYWKKYTGSKGLNFGIDDFGKSAPYKDCLLYTSDAADE